MVKLLSHLDTTSITSVYKKNHSLYQNNSFERNQDVIFSKTHTK